MSSTSRHDDCWRDSSVWESITQKLTKNLGRNPTDKEVVDFYREGLLWDGFPIDKAKEITLSQFIGDDLTDSDLDDLWAFASRGEKKSVIANWIADKPHQVWYRMILRLTRAEARLKEAGLSE